MREHALLYIVPVCIVYTLYICGDVSYIIYMYEVETEMRYLLWNASIYFVRCWCSVLLLCVWFIRALFAYLRILMGW